MNSEANGEVLKRKEAVWKTACQNGKEQASSVRHKQKEHESSSITQHIVNEQLS